VILSLVGIIGIALIFAVVRGRLGNTNSE